MNSFTEARRVGVFTRADYDKVATEIAPHCIESAWVGSSYVHPNGKGKDLDVLVRTKDVGATLDGLMKLGYVPTNTNTEYPEDEFTPMRRGDVNLLITGDCEWYVDMLTASEVCKLVQPANKQMRVAIHRIIMDREDAEQALDSARGRYPEGLEIYNQ